MISFLSEFLLALFISLVMTLVFAVGFRRRNWKASAAFYFLVLFLATWAGGLWAAPAGPTWQGVFWIPFLIAGLVFALLLAVLIPPGGPAAPDRKPEPPMPPVRALFIADTLFRLLVLGLVVVIAAGYIRRLW